MISWHSHVNFDLKYDYAEKLLFMPVRKCCLTLNGQRIASDCGIVFVSHCWQFMNLPYVSNIFWLIIIVKYHCI